ncbi:acylphosphatase [Pyrobaculum aerophilum]|uniref:Acylphosphatase n=2 Tax=Pyrobaculum aerophilum TaxID=13773 RepID=ACYP_PYRAE|nr:MULTISPECIES: acylphosphatase [Pyrobaculum]Q8ZXK6.1 RecName: Full=Acylphosphatase; AltName: Full=Acylphosphate phosphohydrolase [Pyrobaculum aerophilum str. IM2]AAL63341.1 acylphosphatase, putative [Pyrobaculum aerophilum str. IM2]MCX8136347.1 acylphosphatase [Pyrobaculum aerophilum]RFA94461.1 acylphosphatase [Pyrobaculum aerophilum]RFA95493.1 acylphosphatase [Pyrobaculum aerophilum]HII47719.1 acylphosphatase [Pyrobaculum aerophilum]
MEMARAHVFIRGKVQGVFFRQSMKEVAMRNGVKGWVRNRSDGKTVEAVLEGPRDAVMKVLEWARIGPPGARVEDIEVQWEEYKGEFKDFKILPTV